MKTNVIYRNDTITSPYQPTKSSVRLNRRIRESRGENSDQNNNFVSSYTTAAGFAIDQRKYKDELPVNTVNRIKGILNNLNIITVETNWLNSVTGFHSVTVSIENTDLSTNGKGGTADYALASAYGELIERLQNQAHFRLSMNLSQEALEYRGFYYAPDEVYMTASEFLNSGDEWTQKLALTKPRTDVKELLNKWMNISYEQTPSDFIALPFLNQRTRRVSNIPIKMVSKMYMSNGMCAGNTAEEALVQGISEVLERATNKAVVLNKVVPPTIPREYIRQ
jgi:ribosomal protein S12 methylthiotransferase accessory factor